MGYETRVRRTARERRRTRDAATNCANVVSEIGSTVSTHLYRILDLKETALGREGVDAAVVFGTGEIHDGVCQGALQIGIGATATEDVNRVIIGLRIPNS